MKKIFSLFMLFLCTFAMLGIAGKLNFKTVDAADAVDVTVYYCIDDDELAAKGADTVKCNAKLQSDADNWKPTVMTKTDYIYNARPIYSCSFNCPYGGVAKLQFQLYSGSTWKFQNEIVSSWTAASTFNGKMCVFNETNGLGWYTYSQDYSRVIFYNCPEGMNEAGLTSESFNQLVGRGCKYTIPENPVLPGYKFVGWYDGSANKMDFTPGATSEAVYDNQVYYAHWEQELFVNLKISYRYVTETVAEDQYVATTGYMFFTMDNACTWDKVRAHVWNSESSKDVDMSYLEQSSDGKKVYVGYIGTEWTNILFFNGSYDGGNQTPNATITETTIGFYQTGTKGTYGDDTGKWLLGNWAENKTRVNVVLDSVKIQYMYTQATTTDAEYKFTLKAGEKTITSTKKVNDADGKIYAEVDVTGHLDTQIVVSVYEGANKVSTRTLSAQDIANEYLTNGYLSNRTVQTHRAAISAVSAA